jgi:S1/P1 Nuclease
MACVKITRSGFQWEGTMRASHRNMIGLTCAAWLMSTGVGFGWGDEGHEIVATVAASILKTESPATLQKVNALLAMDHTGLVPNTGIASEATWADKFREKSDEGRKATENWHFVNTDFDHANTEAACAHPAFTGPATEGPAQDCVIDKVEQFRKELKSGDTSPQERFKALQFLLHFVGDIHQPLHVITRTDPDIGHEDRGGNCVGILRGNDHTPIKLHGYWDTNLVVAALKKDPSAAAASVMSLLTPTNRQKWAGGDAPAWAKEAYDVAKTKVYAGVVDHTPAQTGFIFKGFDGKPDEKCGPSKVYKIAASYDTTAKGVVKEQLAKAGLRLSEVLKESFP